MVFNSLALTSWLRKRMAEADLNADYALQGPLDEVETIERCSQEGRRPRIREVISKQRAIVDKLGYILPATS